MSHDGGEAQGATRLTEPAPAETESKRAKALPGRPRIGAEPGDPFPLVPARMVNEVLYCERLMYLEWVQGEWESNRFTADGTRVHKRVDASRSRLKPRGKAAARTEGSATAEAPSAAELPKKTEAPSAAETSKTAEERPYQARSVWLSSERLGVTAKLDVVDVEGGKALAVEYKRGKRPDLPEGAYLPERAQVCLHVLLLREHGYDCDEAEIYFAGDRRRTRIPITDELIETTLRAIERVKELATSLDLPPPLVDSPKCPHCSLNSICLPDEVNFLRAKRLPLFQPSEPVESVPPAPEVATAAEPDEAPDNAPRRLIPSRDHKLPVYVTTQGASVRLDGEQLKIYADGEKLAEVRLPNTSNLALFGNVQVSTQALRSLMSRGIPVHLFSYGGWWTGSCLGADSNNVGLRLAQYRAMQDPAICLSLATRWVHSKISNCRTLLRRNHRAADPVTLKELKILARKALDADSIASLLGIEGTAARTYFQSFSGMLSDARLADGFHLDARSRRPPKDPINALLSFTYTLLTRDLLSACRVVGLDPLLGLYHQPHFGRPSLALDLMEEFRPLIADSVVLTAINNGIVQEGDFIEAAGSFALEDKARRRLIETYEQRVNDEITHPMFGYRISYRRVFEVQARLFTRVLLGEIDEYPVFRTR